MGYGDPIGVVITGKQAIEIRIEIEDTFRGVDPQVVLRAASLEDFLRLYHAMKRGN